MYQDTQISMLNFQKFLGLCPTAKLREAKCPPFADHIAIVIRFATSDIAAGSYKYKYKKTSVIYAPIIRTREHSAVTE